MCYLNTHCRTDTLIANAARTIVGASLMDLHQRHVRRESGPSLLPPPTSTMAISSLRTPGLQARWISLSKPFPLFTIQSKCSEGRIFENVDEPAVQLATLQFFALRGRCLLHGLFLRQLLPQPGRSVVSILPVSTRYWMCDKHASFSEYFSSQSHYLDLSWTRLLDAFGLQLLCNIL